jgi:YggT family protein
MTKMGNIIKMDGMSLAYIIQVLFAAYQLLLFARIVSFWFPAWQGHHLVRFLAFYTDGYLSFFRRLIPPLGGVLDLSPILALFALILLKTILLGLVS